MHYLSRNCSQNTNVMLVRPACFWNASIKFTSVLSWQVGVSIKFSSYPTVFNDWNEWSRNLYMIYVHRNHHNRLQKREVCLCEKNVFYLEPKSDWPNRFRPSMLPFDSFIRWNKNMSGSGESTDPIFSSRP